MSEQINEKVVDVDEVKPEIEIDIPVEEVPVEVVKPQPTQLIVMPTKATIGQRIVDTAVTMVASTVVVSAMNIVVNGVGTVVQAGAKKIGESISARKERRLEKKAAKEAARLKKAAEAQEKAEEATPEVETN